VGAKSSVPITLDTAIENRRTLSNSCVDGAWVEGLSSAQILASPLSSSPFRVIKQLSPWARSGAKRFFDCACVVLALPLLVPVMLAIAVAVRVTSKGPVHFLQTRMGRHGQAFTIVKFRTLTHTVDTEHHAVTTAENQCFTPVGRFLRRWKLDELPQLLNVLAGHMSLVGPRPKMPEHVRFDLPCRPGITGAATIAFAREETALARVPDHNLETYYHSVVLPAKHYLDARYMARATFGSDLKLLVDSVLRRWEDSVMEELLEAWAFEAEVRTQRSKPFGPELASARSSLLSAVEQHTSGEQSMSF
jgi:lipopolysaccharide/colanic/teichoic acid biosynthesis glycosyltransferase